MTRETNDKKTDGKVKESVTESPAQSVTESSSKSDTTEQSAGADTQNNNDYGMILEALKRLEENQTRLSGEIASIKDAQSVLVDAGAVIHDDSPQVETDTGVDEFIPIEKLNLLV